MKTKIKLAMLVPSAMLVGVAAAVAAAAGPEGRSDAMEQPQVLDVGSRLELFVDRYLIDKLDRADFKLHTPQMAPLSPAPIKGYYMTVIKDGDLYRAYYRGSKPGYEGPRLDGNPGEITLYAESKNGIEWEYPELDLFKPDAGQPAGANANSPAIGSKGNNVILADAAPCSHNFSPLLDARPGVPSAERFKALAGTHPAGLFAFASRDGIRWKKMADGPVIKSEAFAFDSQNVAFWSDVEDTYVCSLLSKIIPFEGIG